MTRGGRRKDRAGPERRCIVTGETGPTDRLIRFVLSPGGQVVPDLAGRLPGRGAWLTADRALIDHAVKKRLFARAFRQAVVVPDDLADQLERLLAQRLIDTISLARKAGQAVAGAEKVRGRIGEGRVGVLLQARDGAAAGIAKLRALADAAGGGKIMRFEVLDSAELGLAFGRDFAIHAALDVGGFAARACAEATRLSGLRSASSPREKTDDRTMYGKAGPGPAMQSLDDSRGPQGGSPEQDDL